jgi:hypothetical protein
MITTILIWLRSNRATFFIFSIFLGALFGFCGGLLAYGITLLISADVTAMQRKVIIPAFTVLGIGIGLADFWHRGRQDQRGHKSQNKIS